MIVYGLKRKIGYGCIVRDRSQLSKFETNTVTTIVKLKAIKKDDGPYFMFVGDDILIVEDIEVLFNEAIKDLDGESFRAELEEV